jgi:hypothetical protein
MIGLSCAFLATLPAFRAWVGCLGYLWVLAEIAYARAYIFNVFSVVTGL